MVVNGNDHLPQSQSTASEVPTVRRAKDRPLVSLGAGTAATAYASYGISTKAVKAMKVRCRNCYKHPLPIPLA